MKKSSSKTELQKVEVKKTSSKSELKRRDSLKSTSSQTQSEIKRTSSTKSVPVPQRRESVTSPTGFLAKVTCWQQRIDPEGEVNLNKKKKQRPVSIAGDADSVSLKNIGNGLKRTPSMSSLSIPENGVNRK